MMTGGKKKGEDSSISERLKEIVFRFVDGDYEYVAEWMRKMGCKVVTVDKDGIWFSGVSGIRGAIPKGAEPPTVLVQLGFALFGQYWPMLGFVQQAWKLVNAEWRARVKALKKYAEKYVNTTDEAGNLY